MNDNENKWIPKIGDIVRLKGTEKPLYALCSNDQHTFLFTIIEIRNSGIAGGEISLYTLMQDYELVERPKKLEDVLEEQIKKPFLKTMKKTRFEKFGNVMIDIETLSTHKNAAIIEIGAVEFNKFTGEIGETFNVIIKPSDWCRNDRHVDGATIQWWFKQSDEARKRFTTIQTDVDYCTLEKALDKLKYFLIDCDSVDDYKNVVVWGNGSSFDIAILEDAYNYFDMDLPWKFWSVNDVRTIVDLNPKVKEKCKYDSGIKHSAVSDCLHQIKYLSETIKSLGINSF